MFLEQEPRPECQSLTSLAHQFDTRIYVPIRILQCSSCSSLESLMLIKVSIVARVSLRLGQTWRRSSAINCGYTSILDHYSHLFYSGLEIEEFRPLVVYR